MPKYIAIYKIRGANITITDTHEFNARGWENAQEIAGQTAPVKTYQLTLARADDIRRFTVRQQSDQILLAEI